MIVFKEDDQSICEILVILKMIQDLYNSGKESLQKRFRIKSGMTKCSYLYLKVIRPLSRLYGVNSTFTLSPGRILI